MAFFGHGKRNDTVESLVKEQYNNKINRFLDRVDQSGPKWYQNINLGPKPEVDELERLFTWADKTRIERNDLAKHLSDANRRIERLETDLVTTQNKLRQLEADHQRMTAQHLGEVKSLKSQHLGEVNNLKTTHTSLIQKEQDVHGQEVRKLVGELLVNQDDNTGWTDEKLRFRFRKLQTAISSLVSPRNNPSLQAHHGSPMARELDPTGFLSRASSTKIHFLLQSRIWNILYDRYFSAPFGFGVLGRGGPQERLFAMFLSWTRLLGRSSEPGPSTTEVYDLFGQNQLVNDWRATTFKCINESLASVLDGAEAPAASIAALAVENSNRAGEAIKSVIIQTIHGPNSPGTHSLDEQVRRIALDSQELAMQFGLHAARLQLLMPAQGDEVRIGSEVYDCEDGDCDRGAKHVVDLVTLPGLQVIGDGRSDHVFKRTLVPCEIYPRQP